MGYVALIIVFLSSLQTAALASVEGAAQDRLQQAAQLISEQKFGAAREILEALLASAGEHALPETYYQLALCYVKQSEWKKAEETLQVFLRSSPENVSALYLKGYLLFSTGRYEESLKVMELLVARDPEHAASHKVIGLDQFMLGRIELAEVELKRATERAPQDAEARYYLGRIYFTRNNLPSALAAFQRAAELDTSSVKTFNHLGQTYEALVQYPAARAAYLRAIELEKQQAAKSEWPYFNLGALCLKEGRAAEAVDYLQQALSRQPAWSEGKAKLAMALVSLGRQPEALSLFEEAVRLDPRNADARYQYARLLAKIGKQEEAERQLLLFQEQKKQ
ncbi:MAG: hypothetical protein DMG06_26825 [Acidobacteria bacterium]|nr:MAG: hypothetical protein DMG06_26825 [Acidobacteriota bacterium]